MIEHDGSGYDARLPDGTPNYEARTRVGLVLETGEPREVHHFCLLIGYGASARMRIERDHAEILAGVIDGLTIGAPVALGVTLGGRDAYFAVGPGYTAVVEARPEGVRCVVLGVHRL